MTNLPRAQTLGITDDLPTAVGDGAYLPHPVEPVILLRASATRTQRRCALAQ